MIDVGSSKPILVVGRNGQLAQALIDRACRRELPLLATGRPALDVENGGSIEAMLDAVQPKLIVNASAYTAVDRAESEPERAFAVNRDGPARLARAAAKSGLPYIHVSTDYVFDGRKTEPYSESDVPLPLNVYGRSKLEGERVVQDACPEALILRTSWLYGVFGRNFLMTMIRLAGTRELVQVVDDQRGAPTAAIDLADTILDLAIRLTAEAGRPSGTYHLTAAGDATWHDFAQAIFSHLTREGQRIAKLVPIKTADYPCAARRPANSLLDCTRIGRDFGVRLPHWRHSLESVLEGVGLLQPEA